MELFSEHQLNLAYHWLCKQREHYPPNTDIWHFRAHWLQEKRGLLKALRAAQYRFSPLQVITTKSGKTIHLWSSCDALVLKMLTLWLSNNIPLSTHCTHLKDHGGLKATVADVQRHLSYYSFVMRTDVKGYYANIDHFILLEQLSLHIKDKFILNLLWQFMRRTVHYGGLYRDITRGISRGCPLSPLIGAFYLKIVDDRLSCSGLYYVRYMDDVLILASTRWKLRRAVKTLHRCFAALKLEQHPDKTFIGRIEKGFDFLGYHFSRQAITLANQTIRHFREHLHRLYEQQQAAPQRAALPGEYVIRWLRWTQAGLVDISLESIHGQVVPLD